MAPFLKGHRKGHHIFEASTTCLYLRRALQVLYYTASQGGQVLFMGKSPKVSGSTKVNQKDITPMCVSWKQQQLPVHNLILMEIHNRELVVLLQIEMNIYNNVKKMKLLQMTMVLAITKPLSILRT